MKFKFKEEQNFLTNRYCGTLSEKEEKYLNELEDFLVKNLADRMNLLDLQLCDNKTNKFNYKVEFNLTSDMAVITLYYLEDLFAEDNEHNYDMMVYELPKKYRNIFLSYNVSTLLDKFEKFIINWFPEYEVYFSRGVEYSAGVTTATIKVIQRGFKHRECSNN